MAITKCTKCAAALAEGDIKCSQCGALYLENVIVEVEPTAAPEAVPTIPVPSAQPTPLPSPAAAPDPASSAFDEELRKQILALTQQVENLQGEIKGLKNDNLSAESKEKKQRGRTVGMFMFIFILGFILMAGITGFMVYTMRSGVTEMTRILSYEKLGYQEDQVRAAANEVKQLDRLMTSKLEPAMAEVKHRLSELVTFLQNAQQPNLPRDNLFEGKKKSSNEGRVEQGSKLESQLKSVSRSLVNRVKAMGDDLKQRVKAVDSSGWH